MSESTNKTPSALSDTQDVYSSPYEEVNGCLCKVHITKQGNFPVLLAVAIPPLVDTLIVKTLSEPVLYLDPCQLSSLMWIGW